MSAAARQRGHRALLAQQQAQQRLPLRVRQVQRLDTVRDLGAQLRDDAPQLVADLFFEVERRCGGRVKGRGHVGANQ